MKKLLTLILLLCIPAWGNIKPSVSSIEAFGVGTISVTPDGNTVIAAFEDGSIRQFHANGKFKSSYRMPAAIKGFAPTDTGAKLFIAADKLYLMTLSDGKRNAFENTSGQVHAIAADKAGTTGVTAAGGRILFFNLISGKQSMEIRVPTEIYALAVDDTGRTVYAGGKDGKIRAFSLITGEPAAEADAEIGIIRTIAVSANNIIIGGINGVVLIDKTLKNPKVMSRHTDDVRSVAITPDGRFAVSGGDDGVPIIWDTASNNVTSSRNTENEPVMAVAIDPYFRYIVTGTKRHGDTAGILNIQYTANKNEIRHIYAFRDATATLNKSGYVDGNGPFGKYLSYEGNGKQYSFDEIAQIVHKPEKLDYSMPRPKIAMATAEQQLPQDTFKDTEPPVITVNTRGFAPAVPDEIRSIEGTITDNSGVAWARADGKPIILSAKGEFKIEVVASINRAILITAADIYGNTAEKNVALTADILKNNNNGGRNYALLIGINNYKHLAGLKTPEYDVRTLEQILKNNYRYETITLTGKNADRDAIMTEINNLRRNLTEKDRLIIYFAGHGELERQSGNAYWQPYDAMANDDTKWILTSQVTSMLATMKAPVLVISDSCYSGALKESPAGTGSTVLITSGGTEPVADEGKGGHSLFTGVLLDALKLNPTDSTILMNIIKANMPANSSQTPGYYMLSGKEGFPLN